MVLGKASAGTSFKTDSTFFQKFFGAWMFLIAHGYFSVFAESDTKIFQSPTIVYPVRLVNVAGTCAGFKHSLRMVLMADIKMPTIISIWVKGSSVRGAIALHWLTVTGQSR